jgi:putative DNA primase/helicase
MTDEFEGLSSGFAEACDEVDKKRQVVWAKAAVSTLAKMTPIERDQGIKEVAKRLDCRESTLRAEVEKEQARLAPVEDDLLLPHWEGSAAPGPINTGALLQDIKAEIKQYIILSEQQLLVASLFVMFTWTHGCAVYSPMLLVTSPERDCGKSTLLGVLRFLVRRSLATSSIKGPGLFRSITKWGPTFVLDEADSVLAENEDLRAIINAGWTRDDGAIRCDPETNEPCVFPAWAPKIIGMKGRKLPDTTLSRCIIIEMKRKKGSETVQDFDYTDNDAFRGVRARLMRWAQDNTEILKEATPEVPEGFHNRVRANWLRLLAIAELAGQAAAAAVAARSVENLRATFDDSIRAQLLADLQAMFGPGPEPPASCRRTSLRL